MEGGGHTFNTRVSRTGESPPLGHHAQHCSWQYVWSGVVRLAMKGSTHLMMTALCSSPPPVISVSLTGNVIQEKQREALTGPFIAL